MNFFKGKITSATRHLALALLASVVLVSCDGGSGNSSSGNAIDSTTPNGVGVGYGASANTCDGIPSTGNPYPCCDNTIAAYGSGNCTWYAAYRAATAWGQGFYNLKVPNQSPNLGNAKNWWSSIQAIQSQTPDHNAFVWQLIESKDGLGNPLPVPGSIAIRTIKNDGSPSEYGHVAWVEAVTDGQPKTVTVMEQNCIYDNDAKLVASFPDGLSNSTKTSPRSSSYFQHYIVYAPLQSSVPSLKLLSSSGASITSGATYSLTFHASDPDGDIDHIEVNWHDGSPVVSQVSNGSGSDIFTKSFSSGQIIKWSATAYDKKNNSSNMLQGTFIVSSSVHNPTISLLSTSGSEVTLGSNLTITLSAADMDFNLSSIEINWGDGSPPQTVTAQDGVSVTLSHVTSVVDAYTWRAKAFDQGGLQSSELAGTFVVVSLGVAAAPTFSTPAGNYTAPINVTISTSTASATILYTTNGVAPTNTLGTIYSGPVAISSNTTLKAIAFRSAGAFWTGLADSAVSSISYTIVGAIPATPSSPSPGSASSPGATQASSSVGLSWGAVSGATYYDLGVLDIATGGLVVDTTTTSASYTASLTAGKQYRWNVAACNTAGCSTYTAVLYFQTP